MKKYVVSFAMWVFIVFVPAHISFAYSMSSPQYHWGGGSQNYQLYWCNGYYSYSPCPQYYYYPSYYYYSYTYPEYSYYPMYYYYPHYGSYSGNYNYNYNYNGMYWW